MPKSYKVAAPRGWLHIKDGSVHEASELDHSESTSHLSKNCVCQQRQKREAVLLCENSVSIKLKTLWCTEHSEGLWLLEAAHGGWHVLKLMTPWDRMPSLK